MAEDKASDSVFPGTIATPDGESHYLLAIGTRRMSIFKFGLYSIGLYVDKQAWDAFKQKYILSQEEAARMIIEREFGWSLRIAPVRNGSMSHLRDALVRRLKTKIDKESNLENVTSVTATEISTFSGLFPNSPMTTKTVFLMTWNKRSGLCFFRDNISLGCHDSQWIAKSLFGIYTDSKAAAVPEVQRSQQFTMPVPFFS